MEARAARTRLFDDCITPAKAEGLTTVGWVVHSRDAVESLDRDHPVRSWMDFNHLCGFETIGLLLGNPVYQDASMDPDMIVMLAGTDHGMAHVTKVFRSRIREQDPIKRYLQELEQALRDEHQSQADLEQQDQARLKERVQGEVVSGPAADLLYQQDLEQHRAGEERLSKAQARVTSLLRLAPRAGSDG